MTEGVFIALGSNVGDRQQHLQAAIALLDAEERVRVVSQSSFLGTKPVGPIAQDDFLNAVVEIETTHSPASLHAVCLAIERSLGRVRNERWGPRTIDLDIVLFDQQVINDHQLTIPHAEMTCRAFVLEPLTEIAPDCVHPLNGLTAHQMLALIQ